VNIALSVQEPLTLAAIYLSQVGVVGSVFAAALTVRPVVMSPAVAALNIGVGPCWGETCGDMLEAMARITLSKPNDAMACIASRRNRTISLDHYLPGQNSERGSLDADSKLFSKVQIDSKKIGREYRVDATSHHHHHHHAVTRTHNFTFSLAAISPTPPCSAASFEVKSEPHTEALPSVRLCVGLISCIRIFFVFVQLKPHVFGMALLVAASPRVRKRRGEVIRVAFRSPRRHEGDVRVGIAVDANFSFSISLCKQRIASYFKA
jgi:hypothetical protein